MKRLIPEVEQENLDAQSQQAIVRRERMIRIITKEATNRVEHGMTRFRMPTTNRLANLFRRIPEQIPRLFGLMPGIYAAGLQTESKSRQDRELRAEVVEAVVGNLAIIGVEAEIGTYSVTRPYGRRAEATQYHYFLAAKNEAQAVQTPKFAAVEN